MLNMNLVAALNTYRLEHKLTQQALAKKLGVSFTTVNRWLKGHVKPSQIQEYHIQKFIQGKPNPAKASAGAKKRL